MNDLTAIGPFERLEVSGFDFSWMFVVYKSIDRYPGFLIGSNARVYSCWKVRGKSGAGKRCGTERYQSDQWHLISGCVQKSTGYHGVGLGPHGNKLTHGLMMEAFYGRLPDGCEVCHNNGNKLDNRLVNLRYGTHSENQLDRSSHGTSNRGSRHGMSKLTDDDVSNIRRWRGEGKSVPQIVAMLNSRTSVRNVYKIISGKGWA